MRANEESEQKQEVLLGSGLHRFTEAESPTPAISFAWDRRCSILGLATEVFSSLHTNLDALMRAVIFIIFNFFSLAFYYG